jgi:hypothetical protein
VSKRADAGSGRRPPDATGMGQHAVRGARNLAGRLSAPPVMSVRGAPPCAGPITMVHQEASCKEREIEEGCGESGEGRGRRSGGAQPTPRRRPPPLLALRALARRSCVCRPRSQLHLDDGVDAAGGCRGQVQRDAVWVILRPPDAGDGLGEALEGQGGERERRLGGEHDAPDMHRPPLPPPPAASSTPRVTPSGPVSPPAAPSPPGRARNP